jgi:hypothetical protein
MQIKIFIHEGYKSWEDSIDNARVLIDLLKKRHPSLKNYLNDEEVIEECYKYARKKAQQQTKLPLKTFSPGA